MHGLTFVDRRRPPRVSPSIVPGGVPQGEVTMGAPTPHRPLRVLVVEDCPDTRDSLSVLLRRWGHSVDLAADGPTALRQAADHPPDIVLLDIGLPGMSCWDVAQRLRADDGA